MFWIAFSLFALFFVISWGEKEVVIDTINTKKEEKEGALEDPEGCSRLRYGPVADPPSVHVPMVRGMARHHIITNRAKKKFEERRDL